MDKTKLKSLLIAPDTTIKQAMQKLNETAEQILFVVNENKNLLGTITDGDIRRGIINGLEFFDIVEKIMHRNFVSIGSDEPEIEKQARLLMLEKRIRCIPVLDTQGVIVDIIMIKWTDGLEEKKWSNSSRIHSNRVVIMAGGKGSRLDPFTKILPKPLIPIGNKTIIELIMEKYYYYGFDKFTYTLNYKKEYMKLFLKDNLFPYEIDWIEEEEFLGTAGGLSLLKNRLDDTFFVANCDSLLDVDYEKLLKWHKEHKASITIVGCHNEVKIHYGVLKISNGILDKIIEKPIQDVIINTGVYVMEPHILSYIPEGKHLDMNKLIDSLAGKEKITVYPIYGGWLDIGQWEEYKKSITKLGGIESV